jgi:hypothetical protein
MVPGLDLLVPETESDDRHVEIVDCLRVVGILSMRRQAGIAGDDDAVIMPESVKRVFGLTDLRLDPQAAYLCGNEMSVLPT